MFRKIVIASDSFKGSLSSAQVADAAALGIMESIPGCIVDKICIADGGEGTAAVLTEALNGQSRQIEVHDPLGRPVKAVYGIINDSRNPVTAVMDMAQASGLTHLDPSERNPMLTSTYGTGEMIADALKRGCRRFLMGIGGSATNDGGTGMLEALGYRFLDTEGNMIRNCCGGILGKIADIDDRYALPELKDAEFIIACDVDSVFYGPEGAARIFAPQKGADQHMVGMLEEGMKSFAGVVKEKYGTDLSSFKGSGAAGGLGGAFLAFLNASLKKGIDMVLDNVRFDQRILGADMVITGEGRIDSQTSKGKAVSGVLARASRAGIPVVAICGICDLQDKSIDGFKAILPISPRPSDDIGLSAAMDSSTAFENVRKTVSTMLFTRDF
ncbi:MAG: glycerate kinase [Bacteroidales bacterium]|nr:glycerate kinase [Bacteroidales bacterium]